MIRSFTTATPTEAAQTAIQLRMLRCSPNTPTPPSAAQPGTTVLHGTSTGVGDVTLFGLGGAVPVTPFGAWSWDLSEDAARHLLDQCSAVDILITHSPPKGAVDQDSRGRSLGSVAVREAVERLQPALVLCGHIHACWGKEAQIGASRVVNLGPYPNLFEI